MAHTLDLDLIENPYGKRIGGGYSTVLVGDGGRTHVKGSDGGPLCMQGRKERNLRGSAARVVTCYRCIKIMGLESNAPALDRHLYQRERDTGMSQNYMVPGGRQGELIADKKRSPFGMDGKEIFRRGPARYPTQSRLGSLGDNVGTRDGRRTGTARLRGGIARPRGYETDEPATYGAERPSILRSRELAAYAAEERYASPGAKRRGTRETKKALLDELRRVQETAYAEAQEERLRAQANPYRRNGSEAAEAMRLYHSGQASSLKEAWDIVRGDSPRVSGPRNQQGRLRAPVDRSTYYPRSYAAPSAAEAMRLYHSGQASSLKEAWAMVKGTATRRANRGYGRR